MPAEPGQWILIVLLACGAWRVLQLLGEAGSAYPRATLTALALFTAYAIPFMIFIASVDYLEPEPKQLIAAALGWGGCVALAVAVRANPALDSLLAKALSPTFAASWGPALVGPTIEEPVKALGIVMIVMVARSQINSLVDGLVYGAAVGLGFQVVENVFYAVNAVAVRSAEDRLRPVFEVFVMRGFVSGFWSHTVFTALSGFGIARAVLGSGWPILRRLRAAAAAVLGAWLCHFTWNLPMLTEGLSVLGELLVKGVPPLLLVLAITRAAVYREAGHYVEYLRRLADPRIATSMELALLLTHAGRVAARRDAMMQGRYALPEGFPLGNVRRHLNAFRAGQATRRLQRSQARLAVELSRNGEDLRCAAVIRARRQVLAARVRLESVIDHAGTARSQFHGLATPPGAEASQTGWSPAKESVPAAPAPLRMIRLLAAYARRRR
ncbi:MAG: PrsW family intramembrane metalloprotease [Micromonosporaceae bacterium]|nr:PrsW family intramembrane metalloprotease [Micromonosporaceae bacterium]